MYSECERVRVQIWSLFSGNYTVNEALIVKTITQKHLLQCKECRAYMKEQFEQFEQKKAK